MNSLLIFVATTAAKRPTMAWWEWVLFALAWAAGLALYSFFKSNRF